LFGSQWQHLFGLKPYKTATPVKHSPVVT
jgi:hypothetical protein